VGTLSTPAPLDSHLYIHESDTIRLRFPTLRLKTLPTSSHRRLACFSCRAYLTTHASFIMHSQHRSFDSNGQYYETNGAHSMKSSSRPQDMNASRYEGRSLSAKAPSDKLSRQSVLHRLRTTGSPIRTQARPRPGRCVTESSRAPRDLRSRPDSPPYATPESPARSTILRGGKLLRHQGSKFSLKPPGHNQSTTIEVSETCRRPQDSLASLRRSGSKFCRISRAPIRLLTRVAQKS
jgi:hypothetical protein